MVVTVYTVPHTGTMTENSSNKAAVVAGIVVTVSGVVAIVVVGIIIIALCFLRNRLKGTSC